MLTFIVGPQSNMGAQGLVSVFEAQALVCLDGWQESRFARLAALVMTLMGRPIYDQHGVGLVLVPQFSFQDATLLPPAPSIIGPVAPLSDTDLDRVLDMLRHDAPEMGVWENAPAPA